MLFDERELNVFDNTESRTYFKEILQSYYGKNYRATIVLLYSFVIYDLFIKLQTMANEGDKKASKKLEEINAMIADDSKYSMVENSIIEFYKDNCSLYFKRFIEDIEYLKNCRNKCAHLKVNDNTLFVPSDYHVRMLICSMYDNILSVKAPFIMDLFSIVQPMIEHYSSILTFIPVNGLDESIVIDIKKKYLERMTYDSLKKSYKTFTKLLLVSDDTDCQKNIYGLYAFTYAMTNYITHSGYERLIEDGSVIANFGKIDINTLKENRSRRNALVSILIHFPKILDMIKLNYQELFDYIANLVLSKPQGLDKYRYFYPESDKSAYDFFMSNKGLKQPNYAEVLYKALRDCNEFNLGEFMKEMVTSIPLFNGYDIADSFMTFFIKHLDELSSHEVKQVMDIYDKNNQCTNRGRHASDMESIKRILENNNIKLHSDIQEK